VPQWMALLIAVMVVVDIAVLALLLRRRARPALGPAAVDFARIHQLTRAAEERIVGHLQANYGGAPISCRRPCRERSRSRAGPPASS